MNKRKCTVLLSVAALRLFVILSLACRAARFKGFQQQDSQELLRYLLDGMRAEEIKVYIFRFFLSLCHISEIRSL